MGHSRLSASESGRWINCPGSIRSIAELEENRAIKPDRSSDAAMEGTAAHTLCEVCLEDMLAGGWYISADKYKGCKIYVDPTGDGSIMFCQGETGNKDWSVFEVDDDMILAVDVLLHHVREVLESFGANEDGIPLDVDVEIEAYANLGFLGREDLGGRIDVRITQLMGDMHVIDYKHGRGVPVDPELNTQLMIYGLGDNCKEDMQPGDAILTIVQPRCPKNESVASWRIPVPDLQLWAAEVLVPAAEATDNPDSPCIPGEKQCLWCRAASHCDAAHQYALTVAAEEFDDLDDPTPENAKKAVMRWPMEKVLRLKALQPFLESAIKATVTRIDAELQAGRPVEGWKLVEGKSNRRWKEGHVEGLKKKRVPASIIYEKKPASFTKIEKAKGGKYKDLVAEWVEKPKGKATVVPESDKRPALPPSAETDFEDDLFT
jgi:hypothetical protein